MGRERKELKKKKEEEVVEDNSSNEGTEREKGNGVCGRQKKCQIANCQLLNFVVSHYSQTATFFFFPSLQITVLFCGKIYIRKYSAKIQKLND